MKKYVLPLLLMPFLFTGCNYYKIAVNTTLENNIEEKISEGEYFLVVSEDQKIYLSELSIQTDSLHFVAQDLPDEIQTMYDKAINEKTNKYIRDKRMGGKAILKENRIVFREGIEVSKGENKVALNDILKVESIEPDKAKTSISYVIGIAIPIVIIGAIIATSLQNIPFSL
jgi:hypothetical protein